MSNAHQWRVVVTPRAEKELKALPSRDQARIRKDIDVLAISPKRVDARKLRGKGDEWRLRVGYWRVRFRWESDSQVVVTLRVLPRAQAYRQ